jgi:hypothetical protein
MLLNSDTIEEEPVERIPLVAMCREWKDNY